MISRLSSACLALLMIATSVPAQPDTRWRSIGPGQVDGVQQVAEVCPLNDAATGNAFCVSIGCGPGEAMRWAISFSGAGAVPDTVAATFSVDGFAFSPIPMTLSNPGFFRFSAAVDPQVHAPLLEALRSGRTGLVFFDTPQVNPQSFTLSGSSAAVDPVLRACPVSGPTAVSDPEAVIRAELARSCGVRPEALPLRSDLMRRVDIDRDGREDLIFDFGAIDCRDASWCGSGGCTQSVWRAEPAGGFKEVFRDTVYSVAAASIPVLSVEAHGSACGLTGAQGPCVILFRWTPEGRLERLP
jgi:hypothetical protein